MIARNGISVSLITLALLAGGCSPAAELPPESHALQRQTSQPASQSRLATEVAVTNHNKSVSRQDLPLTVKVASIQCSSDLGDVDGNRTKLTTLVRKAAAAGAKIIVLPEAAVSGYLSQDLLTNWRLEGWPLAAGFVGLDPLPFAETVPGPSTRHFCGLADELDVYLTVPLVEIEEPAAQVAGAEPPRLFNTVCLVSPRGELVAHYRKLSPWPHPEQSWATPGDRGVQVYDSEYGRMGLAICFDIHTILEKYEPHEIWALLYPIAWVDETHPAEWFWHRLPERIGGFDHYVIGANWSVDRPQKTWYGYGFSTIYAPGGRVLASAKSLYGSEIVYATIKTAWAKQATPTAPTEESPP